jgi:hypothetical protein
VKRVLLTGISGVGKSTAIVALAARGYAAVDLDSDDYSEWVAVSGEEDGAGSPVEPDRDWMWQEDRVGELLSREDGDVLFVSGSAANMGKFLPRFNHIILLSAPAHVIAERLATRTTNVYGKRPEELARVLGQVETVEPLLRRVSGHEIDTSAPLDEVVATVLWLTETPARPG